MYALLLSLLLIGIVKVHSDQIQCQIVPIKTENGLVGHCCMFTKDTSSEQKRDRLLEQIYKSFHLVDKGGPRNDRKPLGSNQPESRQHPEPKLPTSEEQPMVFYEEHRSRVMEERHNHPHNQPPPGTAIVKPHERINPKSTEKNQNNNDAMLKYPSSGEISRESGIESSSEDMGHTTTDVSKTKSNSTDDDVVLGNRFNINAPKTCSGDSKKTNKGECETSFG